MRWKWKNKEIFTKNDNWYEKDIMGLERKNIIIIIFIYLINI